ncbi:unnamed protein product [Amoebophrya sp. A120]|nr:unnamed protein product [Amoebophrya sp. A120]|eukprot:GSA120T00024802001.1
MRIIIQYAKRKLEPLVDPETATILTLKEFVAANEGPAVADQKMIAKGKERSDDTLLREIPLTDGGKVMVKATLRPAVAAMIMKQGARAAREEEVDEEFGQPDAKRASKSPGGGPCREEDNGDITAPRDTDTVLLVNNAGEDRNAAENNVLQQEIDAQLAPGAPAAPAVDQESHDLRPQLETLLTVKIKQGRNTHTITVKGPAAPPPAGGLSPSNPPPKVSTSRPVVISWQQLADHLHAYCIPDIAAESYRFVAKGKEIQAGYCEDTDKAWGMESNVFDFYARMTQHHKQGSAVVPLQVMLLFKEGHYIAKDNQKWVEERIAELDKLADRIVILEKRVSHRMTSEDTFLEIYRAEALVVAIKSAAAAVGVKKELLAKKKDFQEQVDILDEKLKKLRKNLP